MNLKKEHHPEQFVEVDPPSATPTATLLWITSNQDLYDLYVVDYSVSQENLD